MISVVCKYLPPRTRAIALWPFVFFRTKAISQDPIIINHEAIHLEQQKETLVIPFYILYVIEYILNLIIGFKPYQAYRYTSAEIEAWENQDNLNYLKTRKRYQWQRR